MLNYHIETSVLLVQTCAKPCQFVSNWSHRQLWDTSYWLLFNRLIHKSAMNTFAWFNLHAYWSLITISTYKTVFLTSRPRTCGFVSCFCIAGALTSSLFYSITHCCFVRLLQCASLAVFDYMSFATAPWKSVIWLLVFARQCSKFMMPYILAAHLNMRRVACWQTIS